MKIVVAPDSFKGSLTALEAAARMEKGIKKALPHAEVVKIPLSDGGEGITEALVTATKGRIIRARITGPLKKKIDSFFGILGDGTTAVIETAAAAGLELLPLQERNPLYTSSHGVGELILKALDYNPKTIIVGLGGSATNDGGTGMASALGVAFTDKNSKPVELQGKNLGDISQICLDGLDKRIAKTKIIGASDVKNPLCGKDGATYVYAPQKGASEENLALLEEGMLNYANIIKKYLGIDIKDYPGGGAAGGLGAGLTVFTGAELKSGIDIVMEYCNFTEKLVNSDLLFTGEGKSDRQTAFGKVPAGVATAAKKFNIPVICLSGSLKEGFESIYDKGVDAAFSNISEPMSLENAMKNAGLLLEKNAYAVTRLVAAIKGIHIKTG